MVQRFQWRRLGALPALIAALGMAIAAAPALAGSVTAQSVWSQQNALSRAKSLLPAGAEISGSQCQTVEVGLDNTRYICTLTYDLPASGATP